MGFFRRRAAEAAPRVAVPNEGEQRWIADNLELLRSSGIDVTDPRALGDFYDHLLDHWLGTPSEVRPDPNGHINLVGIGLGEHLRRRTGALSWAVAVADEGAEIALHGQPGDIIIYPTNAVAKRWVDHEAGFLPGFAEDMSATVTRLTGTASS